MNFTHDQILTHIEELKNSDKEELAVNQIYEILGNSKKRGQWTITFEKIMKILIDLCLKLDQHDKMQNALRLYRNMSQSASIESLKTIFMYYKESIEEKIEEKIKNIPIQKFYVLDVEEQNDIFSFFDIQQKEEKQNLRSSIKVLEDTYKNIIEIVKINNKLEDLLLTACEKIFEFYQKYQLKSDFKRFCAYFRQHLQRLQKYPPSMQMPQNQYATDISKPETNTKYCQIYFTQLSTCMHLELWQEAFKTIEDLQSIFASKKGSIKSKYQSLYYHQLSQIFFHSEYHLYRTFSYYNHYQIFKKFQFSQSSQGDNEEKTDTLLMHVLSTPPISLELSLKDENKQKFAKLINQAQYVPKRDEIVRLIISNNLLELASPDIKELFLSLESNFNIWKFQKQIEGQLKKIEANPKFAKFLPSLKTNVLYKALTSVSKIFKVVKFSTLQKILYFATQAQIEEVVLQAQSNDWIHVKYNHEKQIISFEDVHQQTSDFYDASQQIIGFAQEMKLINQKITKGQLTEEQVNKTNETYNQKAHQFLSSQEEQMQLRQQLLKQWRNPKAFEQKEKQEIEFMRQKEAQIRKRQLEQQQKDKQQLLKQEQDRKYKKIQYDKKLKLINDIIKLKGTRSIKINDKKIEQFQVNNDLEEIEEEELQKLKTDIENLKKENLENKNKTQYKKVDYLIRAKREEENKMLKEQEGTDLEIINQCKQIVEETHNSNIVLKNSFLSITAYKDQYEHKQLAEREKVFQKSIQEFKQEITEKYKEKIIKLAKELKKQAEEEKEKQKELEKKQLEEEKKKLDEMSKDQKNVGLAGFRSQPKKDEPQQQSTPQKDQPKPKTGPIFNRNAAGKAEEQKIMTSTTEDQDFKIMSSTGAQKSAQPDQDQSLKFRKDRKDHEKVQIAAQEQKQYGFRSKKPDQQQQQGGGGGQQQQQQQQQQQAPTKFKIGGGGQQKPEQQQQQQEPGQKPRFFKGGPKPNQQQFTGGKDQKQGGGDDGFTQVKK